uniref:Uncharacterized protein n=2 Tax=Picea TaxID=3328 RepID=A0A117NHW8_PICGL|nr:hypothetical protein ABT39_MTgene4365 [Picea glauca]QHR91795.1 hypothetical protein Q903MT_gene5831 [Picea sitchensis]
MTDLWMDGHAPPSLALTSSHGATAFQRQLSQADQSHLLSDAAVLGITITFWGTTFSLDLRAFRYSYEFEPTALIGKPLPSLGTTLFTHLNN